MLTIKKINYTAINLYNPVTGNGAWWDEQGNLRAQAWL